MIRQKGDSWQMYKRVPKRFEHIETRKMIQYGLKMKVADTSEAEALKKAKKVWDEQVRGWEAELEGGASLAEHQYDKARRTAASLNLEYISYEEVAKLPLRDILHRVDIASKNRDLAEVALGVIEEPKVKVSDALSMFFRLCADDAKLKTPDQVRRWKNPKKRAVERFIDAVGDKEVARISRMDALRFREYLQARVEESEGSFSAGSANKDIANLSATLRRVDNLKGYGWELPLSNIKLSGHKAGTRGTFSTEHIKTVLLADGALDGMGWEARCIFKLMINTGARPSEIAGLYVEHLELDGEVPLMWIKGEGKQLKTASSERAVPLVGVSLEAAREALSLSDGKGKLFPTYFGRDKISNTINKYLSENNLKEGDNTSLYSLRHSFESRLNKAEIIERVSRDLLGHSLGGRQRYGDGGGDKARYDALLKIAI